MEEQWKTISAYPKYQVSNLGNVRNSKGELKGQRVGTNTYLRCTVYHGGRNHMPDVHRLVAFEWVENPNGYLLVDHINGDRHDNRAVNLRWTTRGANSINRKIRKDIDTRTDTGVMGITKTRHGTFRVRVYLEGIVFYNKAFATFREAIEAKISASKLAFGDFWLDETTKKLQDWADEYENLTRRVRVRLNIRVRQPVLEEREELLECL